MDITYIGHSSFLIKTKTAKIVTDPFDPAYVGLKYPKQTADIVTISHHHKDHDWVQGVNGDTRVFDWPGEYEKNKVRIFGFQSYHDTSNGSERGTNTIFKIEAEGISLVHLGDLGQMPDGSLIDAIGETDILFVPVGGFYTIDAGTAVQITKKLDPSFVIPMHYGRPDMAAELAEKLEPVSVFLQKMNATEKEPQEKLSIKVEDLIEKDMEVIILKN